VINVRPIVVLKMEDDAAGERKRSSRLPPPTTPTPQSLTQASLLPPWSMNYADIAGDQRLQQIVHILSVFAHYKESWEPASWAKSHRLVRRACEAPPGLQIILRGDLDLGHRGETNADETTAV